MDHSLLIGAVTVVGMILCPFLLEFAPGVLSYIGGAAPAELLAETQAGILTVNEEAAAAQAVNRKVSAKISNVPVDISAELEGIGSRVISPKFGDKLSGLDSVIKSSKRAAGKLITAESQVAKETLRDVIKEEAEVEKGAEKIIKAETEALKELRAKTAAEDAMKAEKRVSNSVSGDRGNDEDFSKEDETERSTFHKIISKSRILSDTYGFLKYRYESIKSALKDTSVETMKRRFRVFGQDMLKRIIAAPFIGLIMGTPAPAHSSQDDRAAKRKSIRKPYNTMYDATYKGYPIYKSYPYMKANTHN